MFRRSIEENLKVWKKSKIRKPLMIRGARQVGKTSVVRKFARENFDNLIEVNLEKKEHLSMFDLSKSVDDFLQRVSVFFEARVDRGKTLVFIDEIQESKNVLELLRFFAEEEPSLHVIATGSLLEVKMKRDWKVPVGRVEYMNMYPLTFFEYLGAKSKNQLLKELKRIKFNEEFLAIELVENLFKEYVRIGGMPEVVANFIERSNYGEVKEILYRIRTAFIDDLVKYAKNMRERKYLEMVMDNGPRLAGELYKYENFGELGYKSREMKESIEKLEKVKLLTQVGAVNSVNLPLVDKNRRAKKMIWLDVGMVNEANNLIGGMMEGVYRGRVMEQVVGQTLLALGVKREFSLKYWGRDRDEGSAEVDFCYQAGDRVVGMEVKSSITRKMKSLFSMVDRGGGRVVPIRVSFDKFKMEEYSYGGNRYEILSLPFWLLERIEDFV